MEQWLLHLEWPFPLTFCLWIIMHPKSSPRLPIKKRTMKAQHCKVSMIYLYWFGPSNFNFWPYLLPTAKRRKRCRQCTGCKTKDCGQCKFCKDMPKFGGLGRKKKPCIFRKCRGMPFASDEGKILCFCSTHSKNKITPAIWLHVLRAFKGMPQHTAWWWPQSKHYRESIPNSSTTDWSKSTLYNARR